MSLSIFVTHNTDTGLLEATSTEATNPISEEDIEASLEEPRPPAPLYNVRVPPKLSCRFLIHPKSRADFSGRPGKGSWTRLQQISPSTKRARRIQFLAVHQGLGDISYTITRPFRCRLYYTDDSDEISIKNTGEVHFYIAEQLEQSPTPGNRRIIWPCAFAKVAPGNWGFYSCPPYMEADIQVVIFPRPAQLKVAWQWRATLSSRRKITYNHPRGSGGSDNGSQIVRQHANLLDTTEGQMIHVIGNGRKVPEYSILRKRVIARTLGASVFLARLSNHPHKHVAVKVLKPRAIDVVDNDEEAKNQPLRAWLWHKEFTIHKGLKSETIVQLIGGDYRLGALYFEFHDAPDLGSRAWRDGNDRFTGTRDDARQILHDMSRALAYLQNQRVLHGDIKPANIVYSRLAGGAKLIDFGSAQVGTVSHSGAGTPWYMAPDFMYAGKRTAASEVWSLGVVIMYLLRRIELPESRRIVPRWTIRDIHSRVGSARLEARRFMAEWLNYVKRCSDQLSKGDGVSLHGIVQDMLWDQPWERVTTTELVRLAGSLA